MSERIPWPLAAVVALLLLIIVAPLVVPVAMSISDTPYIVFPPEGFTLEWYGVILTDPEAQASLRVSLELAFLATLLALALGIPCAMALVRCRFPGRGAVLALVLGPLVVPLIVTGVGLLQFFSMLGMRGAFLQLLIGHTVVCIPYVVRSVSGALATADPTQEDAARVLGAGPLRIFTRVIWPQIRPGVVAGGIFAFIISFDDFAISMWLADARSFPLPLFLYAAIQKFFDPSIAALSALMVFFALGLVLLIEKGLGIGVRRIAG
ncbi:ABC transporter permease [Roseomonas sp. AR75]|uniref:ABC transporter permease n=1 Tax=Roseomonas sp. AR75 TaxID=2562311 RepID=UPI0010BFB2FF|nr:ABC transporter permease [Roseomonas sp. AR75]